MNMLYDNDPWLNPYKAAVDARYIEVPPACHLA